MGWSYLLLAQYDVPYMTRFCAVQFCCNQFTTLIVCVYLPSNYGTQKSNDLFRETIAELHGFLDACTYDNLLVAGDFNVDFDHQSSSNYALLQAFMQEFYLYATDLDYKHQIVHTYERDDGLVRSWPDHIMTLQQHTKLIDNITCIHSASNFSDHLPLS